MSKANCHSCCSMGSLHSDEFSEKFHHNFLVSNFSAPFSSSLPSPHTKFIDLHPINNSSVLSILLRTYMYYIVLLHTYWTVTLWWPTWASPGCSPPPPSPQVHRPAWLLKTEKNTTSIFGQAIFVVEATLLVVVLGVMRQMPNLQGSGLKMP